MRIHLGLTMLFFLVPACLGCAGEEAEMEVSATEGTPVRIGDEPRLRLGTVSGDTIREFYRVRTPFLMPDGRLVVPLTGAGELRVFNWDGEFVEAFGGAGEGPGEFTRLSSAWPEGDTIEAYDGRLRRFTRFLPGGSVQVVTLAGSGTAESAPAGAVPEGWLTTGVAGGEYPGRDLIAVNWFTPDGDGLEEIDRVEGMHRAGTGPHPLSPRAVVRVGNGSVHWGETLTPRIHIWDPEEGIRRQITWTPAPKSSPDDAMSLVRDSLAAREKAGVSTGPWTRLVQEAQAPERLSVFWDFMVDELGFIWIQPYDPAGHAFALGGVEGGSYVTGGSSSGGRWLVLSPDGTEAGSVQVPEGLRLTHITRDAVVGIRLNEMDVETVEVRSLERR